MEDITARKNAEKAIREEFSNPFLPPKRSVGEPAWVLRLPMVS
jgi:hypothetical protein